MFTPEEIYIISSAVETYNEAHRGILNPELQDSLCNSCIAKLEGYNQLTYFSKQEYTVMAFAVDMIINQLSSLPKGTTDKRLIKKMKTVFDRLCTLAR